ncbi:MAG: nucleotide exchange factor GrpE [Bacteroidales bacterium]
MTKKEKKADQHEETTQQEKGNTQETDIQQEAVKTEEKAEEKKEDKKPEKTDKEKLDEMNDKYLRLAAEYDNYRKRTLKEKMELTKTAGADILVNILPVMDDFERALSHLDQAKDMVAVKDGITLIYNKFTEFLKQRGIKEIESKEKDFDTDIHEAVTKIPAPTEELKGKVVDVIEKGYYMYDKVIRFSKVVVGE